MRTLFVYCEFPKTFWSYEKILELVNRKVLLPPLAMVTMATLRPQQWEMKLVDRNVQEVTDEEWNWAGVVIISGMIVQKDDMAVQISKAKQRGLLVAVGGPFASSTPDALELDLADFKILDEGEITLPIFLDALERGETGGLFTAEGVKPDVTASPIPRFDLLQLEAYDSMSMQFSQGCPFNCEFCDIVVLYGRKPRTKTPEQLVAELQYLLDLGWRRSIFLGIETPDEASLETARKMQITRNPLDAAVDLKALSIVVWWPGIKRNTRIRYWRYLLGMARNNPALLEQFLTVLAHNEHFLEYRSIVQQKIHEQLEPLPPEEPTAAKELQPA